MVGRPAAVPAHRRVGAERSDASTLSEASSGSIDSGLAHSEYDPDERSDTESRAPALARQRNLDKLPPHWRTAFAAAPPDTFDGSPAAQAEMRQGLGRLNGVALDVLSGEDLLRAFRLFREDTTQRGVLMLDRLASADGDAFADQLAAWPEAARAQAVAALTWATGMDGMIDPDTPVYRRLKTLCEAQRPLAGQVDASIQRLECRKDGRPIEAGLRVTTSRRAEIGRLAAAQEMMLQTLGIREWRRGGAPS